MVIVVTVVGVWWYCAVSVVLCVLLCVSVVTVCMCAVRNHHVYVCYVVVYAHV